MGARIVSKWIWLAVLVIVGLSMGVPCVSAEDSKDCEYIVPEGVVLKNISLYMKKKRCFFNVTLKNNTGQSQKFAVAVRVDEEELPSVTAFTKAIEQGGEKMVKLATLIRSFPKNFSIIITIQ